MLKIMSFFKLILCVSYQILLVQSYWLYALKTNVKISMKMFINLVIKYNIYLWIIH